MIECLLYGAPDTVNIQGVPVHIETGWRTSISMDTLDKSNERRYSLQILTSYYLNRQTKVLPEVVEAYPDEAIQQALDWRAAGFELINYGPPGSGRKSSKRLFDWDADTGIITADFMRAYNINLFDTSTKMHWYLFCALLLSLMRSSDALIAQAVSARMPVPIEAKGDERKRLKRLAQSWALPLNQDELIEDIKRRF